MGETGRRCGRCGRRGSSAATLCCALLLAAVCTAACGRNSPPAAIARAPVPVNPWKEAAERVEEDRGEPVGTKASVEIPSELRHYRDRRRFLGVQAAASLQQEYRIPEDYADLARMIRQGEFIEMEPLGDDYILYGVGERETDGPLTHYDRHSRLSVPLFATDAEYEQEARRLNDLIAELQAEVKGHQTELSRITRRDRRRRRALYRAMGKIRKSLRHEAASAELLRSYRASHDLRSLLSLDLESLAGLAAAFNGRTYDLADSGSRREFKVRLLSFARPESRNILLDLARAYKAKFGRHLPITSLVRTEEYQRQLSETNSNAARNSTPPHTTGLAFDVYYHYMTAEEQAYVMSEVAKLKAAGRVEALRESRSNIHVFAFSNGRPPDASLVNAVIGARRPRSNVLASKTARKRRPKRAVSGN